MKRLLAVLGLLILIGMCGAGLWISARSAVQPFLVPGATDVQVHVRGLGTQEIRYRVPAAPDVWYFAVGRTLKAQGWRSPTRYTGGPPADPDVYIRVTYLWRAALWERASLDGSVQAAQITVQRWIVVAWP
jgi:hypothetical protein